MKKILEEINRVLKIQRTRPESEFEKGYTTAYLNLKRFINKKTKK